MNSGNRPLLLALGVLGLLLAAPWLAPHSPYAFHADAVLAPPGTRWLFGTDEFGRDVFSRILCGVRPTLGVAIAGALLGVALGTLTGLIAGYFGGWLDEAVMRVMDALMSYPGLILAMLIIAVFGAAPVHVVTALVVVFWPRSTRLCRSVAMTVAQREFVDAARSRGERTAYILMREILPNLWPVIVIDLSLRITSGILISASLAYLGLGFSPPSPAWGLMVRDGQQFIQLAPWLVLFPCLAVVAVAIATVALAQWLQRSADGVRDREVLR